MPFAFFRKPKKQNRLLILGLDCAEPSLIFQQFKDELPHFQQLIQRGLSGRLQSSTPCVTVPAWASMTTGRDPGVLGFYGFRNRAAYDYDGLQVVDNATVKPPRIWDRLAEHGLESLVMNVPQTFPVKPIKGHLASGLLTPGTGSRFAYPAIFQQEIRQLEPDYAFDVRGFRTMARDQLLQQLIHLTDQQYRVFEQMLTRKEWQFAMHVNIALDRMHHAFWRYHDPQHRLHEADSPFRHAIRDYYKLLDDWLGRILAAIDDDVTVLVVSDHGAKRMEGAICINQWLLDNGWLALKQPLPHGETIPFAPVLVDWEKTRAWSTGGYYGRIFLNLQGREPQGSIPAADYERVRDQLSAELAAIPHPDGTPMHTQVFKPEAIYQQVNGIPPDLMVYFGDLHWRTVGGLGYETPYTFENDTGPDDANHAEDGLYILHAPAQRGYQGEADYTLLDIAPTVLHLLGVPPPDDLQGRVMNGSHD